MRGAREEEKETRGPAGLQGLDDSKASTASKMLMDPKALVQSNLGPRGPYNWYGESKGPPADKLPTDDIGPHLPKGGWRSVPAEGEGPPGIHSLPDIANHLIDN